MDMCGWYYKCKNIDKLYPNTNSIWTHFGTLTHKCIQQVLIGEWTPEYSAKYFIRVWNRFCHMFKKQLLKNLEDGEYKLPKKVSNPRDMYRNVVRAIMQVEDILEEEFGPYKVLWIETRLEEKTKYPQVFTGYIDVGLQLVNKNIVIIDIKTPSSHYSFKHYADKYTDYQLTLYKSYYCEKYDIDPKTAETYFLTVAKDPSVKKPIELIRVTSGSRKITNARAWLNEGLDRIQIDNFQKKRTACNKFFGKDCPFYRTVYCSSQKLF